MMFRGWSGRRAAASVAAAFLATTGGFAAEPLLKDLRPFLTKHCTSCHDADAPEGGLDLTRPNVDLADHGTMARWVRVFDRVAAGEMPPQDEPRPAKVLQGAFLKSLSNELTRADAARKGTVLRRLNRLEYENALRDLFGVPLDVKEMLPADGSSHGFDTVGESLDISVVQLQRYLEAGGKAIETATRKGPAPERQTKSISFADGNNAQHLGKHWKKRDDGAVVFFNDGRFPAIMPATFSAWAEGTYRVRIVGAAHNSPKPVAFGVYFGLFGRNADSECLGYWELPPGEPTAIEITTYLVRGAKLRLVPQIVPANTLRTLGVDEYPGPGLAIARVEVEGPLDAWPGRGHELLWGDLPVEPLAGAKKGQPLKYEIRSARPAEDTQRLLTRFVPTAFRRPVSAAAVKPYVALAEAELQGGASFEEAMRTAYTAVLCAPEFVYLRETAGELDDHALAARLAFFLRRSPPDAALLKAAERGELRRPEVLKAQTERLLNAPEAERFVQDFTGQWLNLRDIDFTIPDRRLYPEFDDLLKHSMVQETERYFATMLKENRPTVEFVASDWTVLNERLARHYGIEGVEGGDFRKVVLRPEHRRGGLLTQGSVLKVSANGTNTSPVVRGAWVLERILDEPPPPPPPGIPGVEPDIRGATTLREQLAKHRDTATCNGCHSKIDPPGFALEAYDVIGGLRDNYRVIAGPGRSKFKRVGSYSIGPEVDASGVWEGTKPFAGPDDFRTLLAADPRRISRAVAAKLATFATGRGMGFSDRPALDAAVEQAAAEKYGFRSLLHAIVQSPLFRMK